MAPITIRKHVDSETLILPELRPFVGKTVEIRVREESADPIDDLIDWEYADEVAAELAEEEEDESPMPTLEEVRKATSRITGSMSAAIREERDERG